MSYAISVRVIAGGQGSGGSKSLGRIDRAQDVEMFCMVLSVAHFVGFLGFCAPFLVCASLVAIPLCIMEAVRLSKVSSVSR